MPSLQVAYVWHGEKFTGDVLDGLKRLGFVYFQQIVWDKQWPVIGHFPYSRQTERCWFAAKSDFAWYGSYGEDSDIWSHISPKQAGADDHDKQDHPTQKPLELSRLPIANHSLRGEVIYDPFLGSGTSLIAAERLKRVCCGVEKVPHFVDVAVIRWQEFAGHKATLDGDGRTFDEIARERRQEAA